MITVIFGILLAASALIAVRNWRLGWMAAIVCGILQDPIRKLTPGNPPEFMAGILVVYLVVLWAAGDELQRDLTDFGRRFSSLYSAILGFLVVLGIAAINGVITFGVELWQVPAVSLLTYLIPVPAVLLGYTWLRREDQGITLMRFYAVITSIAMLGTVAEYLRVQSPVLGMVGMKWEQVRHLPGIQIRMLSGIYRGPDIMAWHAAMLASIALILAFRSRSIVRGWPWISLSIWGFINCLISGRRKAIYMFAVFTLVFLARSLRRLSSAQLVLIVLASLSVGGIIREVRAAPETDVYARGARASTREMLQRLEGGATGTLRGSLLGAGLGSATQGTRHLSGRTADFGWQEGGLAKLAAELGLPGLLAGALLFTIMMRLMLRITAVPDIEGTSHLIRAALFALVVANISNFLVSAQPYSDPLLTLLTSFVLGCLFASATLDERLIEGAQEHPRRLPQLRHVAQP